MHRQLNVEARRYAAAARKLAEREADLAEVVLDVLDAGATADQVRVWLAEVLDSTPESVTGRLPK